MDNLEHLNAAVSVLSEIDGGVLGKGTRSYTEEGFLWPVGEHIACRAVDEGWEFQESLSEHITKRGHGDCAMDVTLDSE
jgi:hypothetical protein